ncbi:single-stranded DNA-binding protein [Novosphingobium colocasiae]|uniref:single-stranded DNA-binding protein n=1 Tax=Novosphingobium colocasiae TaxID=1256513 RepID=UPI0035ADB356
MLNSCSFIGNLGKDPEVRTTQGGDKVASLSIACTEKWKTKDGERKERVTWVPVVIWGPLAEVAERYLRKGSKIYVCGKFTVRKWQDRDGHDRWSTEIVLSGAQAQLIMLDSKPEGDSQSNDRSGWGEQRSQSDNRGNSRQPGAGSDDWGGGSWGGRDPLDDDVPF